jgi:DNA polymerase (family X)
MSINDVLSQRLEELAKLLELTGADKFRVLAHQKAARVVEASTLDLGAIARGPEGRKRLLDIDGVGPKIADKIVEFVGTGRMDELEALRSQVPAGLIELLGVPGLGPKTVEQLWKTLGVTDPAGLERAIDDGSILTLPRMGEKAAAKIKASLAVQRESGGRLHLGIAMPVAERVVEAMKRVKGVSRVEFAGSLRRGKETIGDIDILATASDPAAAAEAFCKLPGVGAVLARGESKCSVRMAIETTVASDLPIEEADGSTASGGGERTGKSVQVDLRLIAESAWGAALMYFTGSKEHNVRLRERALKRGLTLNEYGLFPEDRSDDRPPQERGVAAVASASEESVFKELGLPWIPPELREDRGETEHTKTPRLIEVADIGADLHAHTTASDGSMSIADLAKMAAQRGLHTLAVTDHSQSSVIANGLKPDRLQTHIAAIRKAAAGLKGLTLLAGSEVDILADGRLDYSDDLLAELDVVVASPHAALSQDSEKATQRLVAAVSHPMVHILGHPTGRLVMKRTGLSPDLAALFAACKQHDVALEINAHWMRLDLRDTHVHAAMEAGCLISINTDTHHPDDFANLRYGVITGRRGGLTPERCINCWPAAKLHAWLKKKRA